MKTAVFLDVKPCSVVCTEVSKQHAASSIIRYSPILMKGVAGFSAHGFTVQKAATFTVIAKRASNFAK